jgi:hypothetical protein
MVGESTPARIPRHLRESMPDIETQARKTAKEKYEIALREHRHSLSALSVKDLGKDEDNGGVVFAHRSSEALRMRCAMIQQSLEQVKKNNEILHVHLELMDKAKKELELRERAARTAKERASGEGASD